MKTVVINASTNQGGKKVHVGSREVNKPETLAELRTYCGETPEGDEKIVGQFWKSEVIDIQARIRAGAEEPKPTKIFKGLSEAAQDKLLAYAREQGLLVD